VLGAFEHAERTQRNATLGWSRGRGFFLMVGGQQAAIGSYATVAMVGNDAVTITTTLEFGVPASAGRKRFVAGVEGICRENGVRCDWTLERDLLVLRKVVFSLSGHADAVRTAADQIAEWSFAFQSHSPGAGGS
jgi:hypothetical protein